MQTFMPVPDVIESSRILDRRRCWQQVREANRIIITLEVKKNNPEAKIGYSRHPATLMWFGYEEALKVYYNEFWRTCVGVHRYNIVKLQLREVDYGKVVYPPWFGYEPLHSSHRSRLLQKEYEYYKDFDWEEDNANLDQVEYIWPIDIEGKLLPEIQEWYDRKKI